MLITWFSRGSLMSMLLSRGSIMMMVLSRGNPRVSQDFVVWQVVTGLGFLTIDAIYIKSHNP